jgi:radical SAM superfamily enzyme YgiQ (UPF0313 family)
MKRIMLITANTRDSIWRPSGLEYVAEALAATGYEVDLLDLALEKAPDDAVNRWLVGSNYDAVGIGISNTQQDAGRDHVDFFLPRIKRMISKIKQITSAPIILGGYGFSMQPEDILEYVGGDYGVAGCGIPAVANLLERIRNNAVVPGTIVRENRGKYLDIGFKRDMVNSDRYPADETVFVGAHEGCIGNCYHCPFGGGKVKMRSREPAKITAEVRNLLAQGVKRVKLVSCMINASEEYVRSLCEGLTQLPVEWAANILPLPKYLSVDLVDTMKRSGMFQASIGSRIIGSDKILKVYKHGFTSSDIRYASRLLKERGIETEWFTGFGAPGECKATIDETFDLIDSTKVDHAEIITRARIYRNTELFDIALSEGLVSPNDRLLEPAYYPFADDLRDYIWQEADLRENCHVYY